MLLHTYDNWVMVIVMAIWFHLKFLFCSGMMAICLTMMVHFLMTHWCVVVVNDFQSIHFVSWILEYIYIYIYNI